MKKVLETGIEVVFAGLLAGCLFSLYQEAEEAAGGAGREAITGKHIVTSVFSPNPHLDKFHILP